MNIISSLRFSQIGTHLKHRSTISQLGVLLLIVRCHVGRRMRHMTYSTPELLVVGAAQNLVLGPKVSRSDLCALDSAVPPNASFSNDLW
jgi:undecaprenyl pyrophosphate phosphatase UppP